VGSEALEVSSEFNTSSLCESSKILSKSTSFSANVFFGSSLLCVTESTVIADLSPSDRPGASRAAQDALTEDIMDRLDIPAFLRKQATGDDEEIPLIESRPKRAPRKPGLFSRLIKKTASLVQFKRAPRKKTEVVKDVLWQIEEIALPEKIAPRQSSQLGTSTPRGAQNAGG